LTYPATGNSSALGATHTTNSADGKAGDVIKALTATWRQHRDRSRLLILPSPSATPLLVRARFAATLTPEIDPDKTIEEKRP